MADAIPVTAEPVPPKAPAKAPKAPVKSPADLSLDAIKAEAEADGKQAYFVGNALRIDS